ncbi:porin [Flavicella sp.]|uniref:porin n=1 Tax=Flavicella sp. TaxID=2957742 RepID=UPI003017A301
MRRIILGIAVLFTATMRGQLTVESIKTTKFGAGIINFKGENNSWSIKLGARMQLLSTNQWFYSNGNLTEHVSTALVRRSRLKFDGFVYDPTIKYKLEFGLSNNDLSSGNPEEKASAAVNYAPRMVLDAVVMWNFVDNFEVWFGQAKLPGNVERVISSSSLQLVDRSRLNSEFNLDRSFGVQLRHNFNLTNKFVVRERIAVSQGEGRNVTIENEGGYQYTGRVELLPFGLFEEKGEYKGGDLKREKTPKLMLSSTYDYNVDARKTRGSQGKYFEDLDESYVDVTTDVTTVFIDAMFKYKGLSFMGEYAYRDAGNDLVSIGNGLNLQTGYLFKNNWELATRYTNVSVFSAVDGGEERNVYTLGVSKYVVGHKLKVQSDISYTDIVGSENRIGFRVQVEIQL